MKSAKNIAEAAKQSIGGVGAALHCLPALVPPEILDEVREM